MKVRDRALYTAVRFEGTAEELEALCQKFEIYVSHAVFYGTTHYTLRDETLYIGDCILSGETGPDFVVRGEDFEKLYERVPEYDDTSSMVQGINDLKRVLKAAEEYVTKSEPGEGVIVGGTFK